MWWWWWSQGSDIAPPTRVLLAADLVSFTPLALVGKSAQASIGSLTSTTSQAPVGGDVNTDNILRWLTVAFIIWWVIGEPTRAVHIVYNIGKSLTTAAHGISSFFFVSL